MLYRQRRKQAEYCFLGIAYHSAESKGWLKKITLNACKINVFNLIKTLNFCPKNRTEKSQL